ESQRDEEQAAAALNAAEQQHAVRREHLAVLEAERESVRQRIAMLVEQRDERARRMARLADDAEAARTAATLAAQRLQQADQERAAAAQHLVIDESELSRCVAEL